MSKRLSQHNGGKFRNSYVTRFDDEWQLIYKEEVATRHEARLREKQLKSFRGREFVKQFILEYPPTGGGRAE